MPRPKGSKNKAKEVANEEVQAEEAKKVSVVEPVVKEIVKAEPAKTKKAPVDNPDEMLLVRATRLGYFGDQRRFPIGHGHPKSGVPFFVKRSEFSDSTKKVREGLFGWMEIVKP